MTPAANKRTVRRLYEELFGAGHFELADELMAVDYINHDHAPRAGIGRKGARAAAADLHQRWGPEWRRPSIGSSPRTTWSPSKERLAASPRPANASGRG
ncbi:MAG: hypothetical protein ACYC0H_05765 [Solirubrobacteraceae bacterium]